MTIPPIHIAEQSATAAFDRQAPVFDALYGNDTIIQYKRKRVRDHVAQYLLPNSDILELNAGTGEDAIHFAANGHRVHATDLSAGMQEELKKKVAQNGLTAMISTERCSFTALEHLNNKGPYDHIFSNFAGLNCTNQLDIVLGSFTHLLRPGGYVTLVLLPKFCLWESMLVLRGKFRTAFRRFTGKKGAKAYLEGVHFRCWYYQPSFISRHLEKNFTVKGLEGLCTIVPPSYMTGFAEKHPWLYRFLVKVENKWRSSWPWRSIGDYYIITLQKK